MTRELLKEALYKRLYKEESARQDIFHRILRRKPSISSTADIAGEDYEAVRADVNTSKLFRQTSSFRNRQILGMVMPALLLCFLLFQLFREEQLDVTRILMTCLIASLPLFIVLYNLRELLANTRLEIKVTGIMHNDWIYPWENILDTCIVIRRGRAGAYLLVLLMDDGEIVRIRLTEFQTLQHNPALDISYYIEHYKRLRNRTVLA
ncbi:hypothetical protein SAMN05428949_5442 [Chitinophaga sp. YR627]|uniref:hypothetical protein n=1 Tax=Chitinophaga sp. YR627 TaxID=1881041 RepID=UPI0008E0ADA1|nr:hypothetical protein [Chitinophaga sp. YR627]SFO50070.1 hypothetical protein SAMN05428949_5442 [Chitinophaga sp. YR627]